MIRLFKNSLYIFLSFLLTFLSGAIYAQDWVLSVENIQPENCVSNGGFTIKITGSDAGSLTSVQYGVTSAEYNVTPNNSPIFIGAPKGTYTVLVEAFYMGGYVSKTINVTVPGDYVYPGFSSAVVRNSLSCESAAKGYGQLGVSGIVGSSKPYTFELTETPPGYTGQTIFTVSSTSGILEELISGTYKIQMTDACGSKTAVHSITIKKLYLGDIIPLLSNGQIKYPHANFTGTNNCNYYRVEPPHINTNAYPDWSGYLSESSPIKWAVSFVGHEADKSEYKSWVSWSYNHVKLPGGKTYKDYYGSSNIDYLKLFLQLPCGTDTSFVLTKDSPNLMYYYYAYGPYIDWKITSVCDKGILIGATLGESTAIICYPMEVEVYNYNSSTPTYYKKTTVTEAGSIAFTDTIPYGKYTLRAVSADGAIFGGDYEKNSPSKFGYKLGRNGYSLHNKVEFIQITRGSNELLPVGTKYALLDTLDGVGYGYQAVLTTATSYLNVQGSDDPSSVNYYPSPGRYIYRVTDVCGNYDIEVEILPTDVYVYTLDLTDRGYNCEGMYIVPNGTTTFNNASVPTYFVIQEGPVGYPAKIFNVGDTILLKKPGQYVIRAAGSNSTIRPYGYYPHNIKTESVTCTLPEVGIDGSVSQGFVCIGGSDTDGQISVRGKGGTSPYKYYLYRHEQDAINNTNLIADNLLGDFVGWGLKRDTIYWVKIVDDCQRASNIAIKILNLSTAQLVFSDKPSYCEGDSIALHAIALPNPTYSWTGPNGFTSTSQRPVIYNITTANSGAYKVTITSSSCGAPTEYTLNLTVNGKAQASEVLIPSIVTVLHGSKAQLKPSAASNVQTPSFSWYDSQTSLAPLYSHAAGGHFETSPLTKDTTYYVAVSGSNMCENTVSNRKPVYVRILNIPEMALTDICSTNPYIALNNTYTDNTYTWEYSVDGTGSWQPELTTTTETKLNVNKEGFYRLSINHNGMPAYNVSQGIQVILNRKVTLPGGILWYDMSYNLVTINW